MDVSYRKGIGASMVIAVLVILVVVAAGGIYLATQSGGGTPSSTTTTQSTTPPTTTSATTTTAPITTTSTTAMTSSAATTTTTSAQTTTTTQSTYSCSATYTSTTTTTTGAALTVQSVLPYFQSLSAMEVQWNGTSNGTPYNLEASYRVIYADTSAGMTTYKVEIDYYSSNGAPENGTAWVQSNGNVTAVDFNGYNETGSMASSILVGLMTPFTVESSYVGYIEVYTGTYFHSSGTSTVTVGPTTMTVTNYQANNLPETYTECGYTGTLNSFSMSYGTVPGTSISLVTYLNFSGTSNGDSGDFTLRVVSVTKA
ncbi:MAG: hypothetical protein JRN08_03555 [Nitrososphaerota archaeon]|nr:hypothetical protein [Nitrososphaerota archaeon]